MLSPKPEQSRETLTLTFIQKTKVRGVVVAEGQHGSFHAGSRLLVGILSAHIRSPGRLRPG